MFPLLFETWIEAEEKTRRHQDPLTQTVTKKNLTREGREKRTAAALLSAG